MPGLIWTTLFNILMVFCEGFGKLEDLKVLRRSPDLFNNVKIGQGFTAYNKTYFVLPYMGITSILVKWPKTI